MLMQSIIKNCKIFSCVDIVERKWMQFNSIDSICLDKRKK